MTRCQQSGIMACQFAGKTPQAVQIEQIENTGEMNLVFATYGQYALYRSYRGALLRALSIIEYSQNI